MLARFLFAIPLAFGFVTLSDQWNIGGWILGYAVGVGVLFLAMPKPPKTNPAKIPSQLFWAVTYVLRLAYDIVLSGVDVARRVLDPNLPIKPGELTVPTHDVQKLDVTAALSGHSITITPGEMVIAFQEVDGAQQMIVHSLDTDKSGPRVLNDQITRMRLIQRIVNEELPVQTVDRPAAHPERTIAATETEPDAKATHTAASETTEETEVQTVPAVSEPVASPEAETSAKTETVATSPTEEADEVATEAVTEEPNPSAEATHETEADSADAEPTAAVASSAASADATSDTKDADKPEASTESNTEPSDEPSEEKNPS